MVMDTETENLDIPEHWQVENERLFRNFKFPSYSQCVEFTNEVAQLAQQLNHHPSITLEYSGVALTLFSHDKGKITERDIEFAKNVNGLN